MAHDPLILVLDEGTTSTRAIIFAADGAVVSDTPGTGLDCPVAGNPITCSASGGAACPGAASLPGLVGAGVAVPTLPVGGTVTFTVPCQVTASGL